MKTFVLAVVLFAATNVLGQNPYEYVDDDLIQKVGQIVYEYDQKVAESRYGGSSTGFNIAATRSVNDVSGGYQLGRQERVARVTNLNNVGSYSPQQQQQVRSQRQLNQVHQQSYVKPQQYNSYQVNRNQRQLVSPVQARAPAYVNYQAPAPVNRAYQAPRQMSNNYQAPAPVSRAYQAPLPMSNNYQVPAPVSRSYQAPVSRTYQAPQAVQQQQPLRNSGFSAYTLSQPEVVARVAEFHDTVDQQRSNNGLGSSSVRVGGSGVQHNAGYRFA